VSGNHEEIKSWRRRKSFERTLERRSDLISNENYKKLPQSKWINKNFYQLMNVQIGNDFHYYPDW
jgi:2-C-methyl-D-erythritol 2,4-cyclodiphosphate synthase